MPLMALLILALLMPPVILSAVFATLVLLTGITSKLTTGDNEGDVAKISIWALMVTAEAPELVWRTLWVPELVP